MLIVVTGAQGFLGSHLVRRLAGEGYSVLAVDRRPQIDYPVDDVIYHVWDSSDPTSLIPTECEPIGDFMLIHLAWDLRNRESSYRNQADQVSCLAGILDGWSSRGLRQVIVPGSAQEYGGRGGVVKEDDSAVEPLYPYGWAKRATREMASSWAQRTHAGLLWLRPFIVYGPGQAGSMLIPYAIRQARAKLAAQFSDCLQERDFVHVDDVIEAIVLGIQRQLPGIHVCNIGCGKPVRARDVIEHIGREFGSLEKFEFGVRERRLNEPNTQVADISSAKKLLDWSPRIMWEEGINRLCGK